MEHSNILENVTGLVAFLDTTHIGSPSSLQGLFECDYQCDFGYCQSFPLDTIVVI